MAKRKGPRAKTSAGMLEALRRRHFVLEMRLAGWTYDEIAHGVRSKFGDKVPRGYDRRYAYKDLMRSLEAREAELEEGRDMLRQLELDRLDKMQASVWNRAAKGDREAIGTVLNLMARRAKLTGIDAPIEYTIDDIRSIARKVMNVLQAEITDAALLDRVFDALGWTSVPRSRPTTEAGDTE